MKNKLFTLAVIFLFFSLIFIQVSASETKDILNETKNQQGDAPIYTAVMAHTVNMNVKNVTIQYLIKIPLRGGYGTVLIGVRVTAETINGELKCFKGEFKFENEPYEVKFAYFKVFTVDIDDKPYTNPGCKILGGGFGARVYL